ncbi:MAG: hypothetical protein H6760_04110 [Candidatus Nomurabacteria bacterium]|nr:MAG: hypothetical protein H6760_04110 [Candidatus Nomurabacteria bacterium]
MSQRFFRTLILSLAGLALPSLVFAQDFPDIGSQIGLGGADPQTVIVNIIQTLLGFASLVALVFVILGGFQWMLSAGNDEKIARAKKTISAAIIGIIIVLISWAIVQFVINTVLEVTQ